MSSHLAFLRTPGTLHAAAYATAALDDVMPGPGMYSMVVSDCESMVMGVLIVPLDKTRTEWSSYPSGVDGNMLDTS